MFDAILYTKWEKDPNDPDTIIGRWAEDNTIYKITIPNPIRGQLVDMQNWLCEKIRLQSLARHTLNKMEEWWSE